MPLHTRDILSAYASVQSKYDFGYDLKELQVEVLVNIINKGHTLAVLPTGFGKSDLFVLTPLILDELHPENKHVALVVVPLISLMADLHQKYSSRGVKVFKLRNMDDLPAQEMDLLKASHYSVLLLSPEYIEAMDTIKEVILDNPRLAQGVCLLAVDEAHLLIQWGQKFRPSYMSLSDLRSHFESAPVLLTTATCPPDIKTQMFSIMRFTCSEEVKTIAILPDRPNINLNYHHRHAPDMEDGLQWYLDEMEGNGRQTRKAIVYCRSIRRTARSFGMILFSAREAAFDEGKMDFQHKLIAEYHAEVDEGNKARILDEFRKPDSRIRCLISTVAFGMGIDIPDVRLVIHWGESDSVSQYWQEVGRAGRDGQPAEAHLYHDGQQLSLCHEDMQSLVNEVSVGGCIRHSILKRLTLEGMQMPGSTVTLGICCSVCADATDAMEMDDEDDVTLEDETKYS